MIYTAKAWMASNRVDLQVKYFFLQRNNSTILNWLYIINCRGLSQRSLGTVVWDAKELSCSSIHIQKSQNYISQASMEKEHLWCGSTFQLWGLHNIWYLLYLHRLQREALVTPLNFLFPKPSVWWDYFSCLCICRMHNMKQNRARLR